MKSESGEEVQNVRTYSFRVDFVDGTFDVVSAEAATLAEAAGAVAELEGVEGTTCLGSVGHEPEVFLAW